MKRKKLARKQSVGQKSWVKFIILFFIVILLSLFVFKINSSVTIDSQAAGGCNCGNLKCFNGNNLQKSYTEKNGQPQCCFGWPKGKLENVNKDTCVKGNTESINNNNNIDTDEVITIKDQNCQTITCNSVDSSLRSTKAIKKSVTNGVVKYYRADNEINGCSENYKLSSNAIVNYCSYSCTPITIDYGSCKGQSIWQKINENYDPAKDQVRIVGSYTDSNCSNVFNCFSNPTLPSPTLIPTIKKIKRLTIKDVNKSNLRITQMGILKFNNTADSRTEQSSNLGLKFGDYYKFDVSTDYKYIADLTNDLGCQKDIDHPLASFQLKIIYRENGFFSGWFPKVFTQYIPCSKDSFDIEVPLTY